VVEPWGGEWLVSQYAAGKRAESVAYGDALRVRVDNICQKGRYLWLRKFCTVAVRFVSLGLSTIWHAPTYV
jgi:hypothetical protein